MKELHFKPALELGRMLRARKISARELLDEHLNHYAKHNDALNAIVVTDLDRARKAALAADRRLKAGKALSAFDGVTATIKESFNWKGLPTTFGNPSFRNNIAGDDAIAARLYDQSGIVIYGKTNVPLDLSDWQTYNDIYGTTNNPWDVSRVPGGSSGGAAAALASGMSAIELGSDIGASIRNPAHYCGVFGHKPTYGVVPYRGQSLPGNRVTADITVAGPMARSARDLEKLLGILAFDEKLGVAVPLPKAKQTKFKDFKVAVKLNSSVSDVAEVVQAKIRALGEALRKKVKAVSFEARPAFSDEENYEIYITLLRSTATKKHSDEEYLRHVEKDKAFKRGDLSYLALMARGFALSHREWLQLDERRHEMIGLWNAFFDDWDVMLTPIAATTAYKHDHVGERHERMLMVNGKKVSHIDQRFWAGYSCGYYLPSTVAPLGLGSDGLPVGVQIITRSYGDYTAIKFAELIEQVFGGFIAPKGY